MKILDMVAKKFAKGAAKQLPENFNLTQYVVILNQKMQVTSMFAVNDKNEKYPLDKDAMTSNNSKKSSK